jgi:uncharacterized protein (TIGR02300 family)
MRWAVSSTHVVAGPRWRREIVPLAKAELGTKRLCQSCGAKFYDLNRSPIVCPKCETVFDLETTQKKRPRAAKPSKPEPEKKAAKKPAEVDSAAEDETDEEIGLDDEEEGDDYIEDTSELDDDDISDVSIDSDNDDDT